MPEILDLVNMESQKIDEDGIIFYRKNAAVSESLDCQEEERTKKDLLPEVTDKMWLPAFLIYC